MQNSERISTLKAIKRGLLLGYGGEPGVMASPAMALMRCLRSRFTMRPLRRLSPGRIFRGWKSPANAGHDFVIEPVAVRS